MLVPQSLAYAMLAGLPPQVGLYASILPLIAYAIFGTSRALAVGPVAVVSLMTAAAVGQVAAPGSAEYLTAAITLAFLSGLVLVAMSVLAAGVSGQFPEPSGDLGLHHRLGHPDRGQPAQAHPRHQGRGRHAAGTAWAGSATGSAGLNPYTLVIGVARDGLPVLDPQAAEAAAAGARPETADGRSDRQGRPGGGHRAVDPGRGRLRSGGQGRQDRRRYSRRTAALCRALVRPRPLAAAAGAGRC